MIVIPSIILANDVWDIHDDVFTDPAVISDVQVLVIYLLFDHYILLRFGLALLCLLERWRRHVTYINAHFVPAGYDG